MATKQDPTTRTFKSQRAATMAVNKADRAYGDSIRADENGNRPPQSEVVKVWEHLEAVCANAERQGFRANSGWKRYFDRNRSLGGWD